MSYNHATLTGLTLIEYKVQKGKNEGFKTEVSQANWYQGKLKLHRLVNSELKTLSLSNVINEKLKLHRLIKAELKALRLSDVINEKLKVHKLISFFLKARQSIIHFTAPPLGSLSWGGGARQALICPPPARSSRRNFCNLWTNLRGKSGTAEKRGLPTTK